MTAKPFSTGGPETTMTDRTIRCAAGRKALKAVRKTAETQSPSPVYGSPDRRQPGQRPVLHRPRQARRPRHLLAQPHHHARAFSEAFSEIMRLKNFQLKQEKDQAILERRALDTQIRFESQKLAAELSAAKLEAIRLKQEAMKQRMQRTPAYANAAAAVHTDAFHKLYFYYHRVKPLTAYDTAPSTDPSAPKPPSKASRTCGNRHAALSIFNA